MTTAVSAPAADPFDELFEVIDSMTREEAMAFALRLTRDTPNPDADDGTDIHTEEP